MRTVLFPGDTGYKSYVRVIRGLRKYTKSMDPRHIGKLLGIKNFLYVVYKINNYCNLNCEFCNYACDIPISKDSSHPCRRKKEEISVEEATLFCERFKKVSIPEIQWTGGEPTMLPTGKFNAVIDIFNFYGKDVGILTNGYNLLNIDKDVLKKFKSIYFDDHVINREHIDRCIEYLKGFYRGLVMIWTTPFHYDFHETMKHDSNKGKSCSRWMTEIKVDDYVVYPCCTMPAMMILDKSTRLREELEHSGWTLRNENLIETMINYRKTLPGYVIDQCLNNCWMPNYDAGRTRVKITLKSKDIIFKKL